MVKRITAASASREFLDILDRVEHSGEEFVVERRGRPVARLVPMSSTPKRITIGDFVRSIESVPKPHESFIADIADIHRRQPRLPKNPWPSSSTRPARLRTS